MAPSNREYRPWEQGISSVVYRFPPGGIHGPIYSDATHTRLSRGWVRAFRWGESKDLGPPCPSVTASVRSGRLPRQMACGSAHLGFRGSTSAAISDFVPNAVMSSHRSRKSSMSWAATGQGSGQEDDSIAW